MLLQKNNQTGGVELERISCCDRTKFCRVSQLRKKVQGCAVTVLSCMSQCVAQHHSRVVLQQRSPLPGQQLYHFRVTQEGSDLQGDESLTQRPTKKKQKDSGQATSKRRVVIRFCQEKHEMFREAGNYVMKGTHLS